MEVVVMFFGDGCTPAFDRIPQPISSWWIMQQFPSFHQFLQSLPTSHSRMGKVLYHLVSSRCKISKARPQMCSVSMVFFAPNLTCQAKGERCLQQHLPLGWPENTTYRFLLPTTHFSRLPMSNYHAVFASKVSNNDKCQMRKDATSQSQNLAMPTVHPMFPRLLRNVCWTLPRLQFCTQ